jgi:hypothetical protein
VRPGTCLPVETLQRPTLKKQPVTLSSQAYVGHRTATITLRPGQWMFYATPAKKTYFIVHS